MISSLRLVSSVFIVVLATSVDLRSADAFAPFFAASAPSSRAHYLVSSIDTDTALNAEEVDVTPAPSRRAFLSTTISTAAASAAAAIFVTTTAGIPSAAYAASQKELVSDLNDAYTKLRDIPDLLKNSEWDKVRTILKTPPLVQLWNLGDSKNTLVQLARETGEMELLEAKDELAISLQMTDQYTYDNVFVYFQPGNGKIKIKEPVEMAEKALVQLKEVLSLVNE